MYQDSMYRLLPAFLVVPETDFMTQSKYLGWYLATAGSVEKHKGDLAPLADFTGSLRLEDGLYFGATKEQEEEHPEGRVVKGFEAGGLPSGLCVLQRGKRKKWHFISIYSFSTFAQAFHFAHELLQ